MIIAKKSKAIPKSRRDDIINVIPSGLKKHLIHFHHYNRFIPSGLFFVCIL
jgi:hypothetical protein